MSREPHFIALFSDSYLAITKCLPNQRKADIEQIK